MVSDCKAGKERIGNEKEPKVTTCVLIGFLVYHCWNDFK